MELIKNLGYLTNGFLSRSTRKAIFRAGIWNYKSNQHYSHHRKHISSNQRDTSTRYTNKHSNYIGKYSYHKNRLFKPGIQKQKFINPPRALTPTHENIKINRSLRGSNQRHLGLRHCSAHWATGQLLLIDILFKVIRKRLCYYSFSTWRTLPPA